MSRRNAGFGSAVGWVARSNRLGCAQRKPALLCSALQQRKDPRQAAHAALHLQS